MSKHRKRLAALLALLGAIALLVVGCGGDDEQTAGQANAGGAEPVAETSGAEVGELVAALAYVNDAGFHDMAEALAGGEMESSYASTVRTVQGVVGAVEWPQSAAAAADAFATDLEALDKALTDMNAKASARTGKAVHESQHGFSEGVLGSLADSPGSVDVAGTLAAVNFTAGAELHEMAESLAAGELEPYYLDEVRGVIEVVAATAWPQPLAADAKAFEADLKGLEGALAEVRAKAAAKAGEAVHASQHELGEAAVGRLGGLAGGPEVAQAVAGITYLDAVGFHEMGEELAAGRLEPHYLEQLRGAIAVVKAVEWPGELAGPMRQLKAELVELEAALADQDAAAAAAASEHVHASQHGVSDGLLAVLGVADEETHRAAEGDGNAVTVEITDWAFERPEIEVAEGDVTLKIVNRGEMPHGIFLSEFKVNEAVAAGETKEITFHADETGRFQFVCSEPMCGSAAQHAGMLGQLIVKKG